VDEGFLKVSVFLLQLLMRCLQAVQAPLKTMGTNRGVGAVPGQGQHQNSDDELFVVFHVRRENVMAITSCRPD
jgi:hypothetical protein